MSRLLRRGVIAGGFATLSASLTPTALSGASSGSTVTTSGSAAISVTGGSGSYTYAWERVSGSASISAVSATSSSSTFRATGMTEGQFLSGVWRGVVTDTVTGQTANTSNTVSIDLERSAAALSASLSPSSLSGSGTGATVTTSGSASVTVSGGVGPFAYAWERVSGSAVPTAVSGSSASTTFTTSSITAGTTQSAAWRCKVTDTSNSQIAYTGSVSIDLTRNYTTLGATVTPTSLSGSSASAQVNTSGSATVTGSGGSGSYSYQWFWDGTGTGGLNPIDFFARITGFTSTSGQAVGTVTAGFYCRVTDTVTSLTKDTGSVNISLTRVSSGITTAAVTPSSQAWDAATNPGDVGVSVVHDGVGPFAYSWSASPSLGTVVSDPTQQTTAVSRTNGTTTVTMSCRVTDNGAGGVWVDAATGEIRGFGT